MTVSVDWNTDALTHFTTSLNHPLAVDDLGGKKVQDFARGIEGVDLSALPSEQISRTQTLDLARNPQVGTRTLCAAIMAWGGMRANHRDMLFAPANTDWIDLAEGLRNHAISRKQAFEGFSKLREDGKLAGVGPAYFTKIIYFLTPRDQGRERVGYIMDQWAGCSINLLVGRELVLMNATREWKRGRRDLRAAWDYRVSDVNTADVYEEFCKVVDLLAKLHNLDAEHIDRALIATGGHTPTSWRRYVMENRTI